MTINDIFCLKLTLHAGLLQETLALLKMHSFTFVKSPCLDDFHKIDSFEYEIKIYSSYNKQYNVTLLSSRRIATDMLLF